MVEKKRNNDFIGILRNLVKQIAQIILDDVSMVVEEGADIMLVKIENKFRKFQKKLTRKITSVFLLLFGGVFLSLAFLFFLIEVLMWSKSLSFLVIGLIILISGLLLNEGFDA